MGNAKAIVLCILGGVAFIAMILVLIHRSRRIASQETLGPFGHRLLAHSRDRDDYRLFVGMPPANPTAWVKVLLIDESSVTLEDSQVLNLSDVTAYIVAHPSGALVDYRCSNDLPMPAWAKFLEEA